MFDFVQKFIYWVLSLQEKRLKHKLGSSLKRSFSNSTSKIVFSKSDSLKLNSMTEKNKEKLDNELKTILKNCQNNPDKILEFIRKHGTKIHKIPFADKFLRLIGLEEGFITTVKGIKALYLTCLLAILGKENKISLTTKPMFVMRDLPLNSYYTIQQFHKWYATKLDMPGFDAKSQENFQKYLDNINDESIKNLSMEEIIGLKEAIARDVEAINFVVKLAKSTDGAKNVLNKMATQEGASV